MKIFFSDFFEVAPSKLERYGAFNISLVADLPLFVDPFLLFNSKKRKYRVLHDRIIEYLRFLRDKSASGAINTSLVKAWYKFPEVKQNWFGFTASGNSGSGLGMKFAVALSENLNKLFGDFGNEKVTLGSHLEKLCLIRDGVGRDNISDFTTRLIQEFLLDYTQTFTQRHIRPGLRKLVAVERVHFNYETETWEPRKFDLPRFEGDYVILTPSDILTKDDTWINRTDLVKDFDQIPDALPNDVLRAHVNNYFNKVLPRRREPTVKDRNRAAIKTLQKYPALIDYYIRWKEEHGDKAMTLSSSKVAFSKHLYVEQFGEFAQLLSKAGFYELPGSTYDEAKERLLFFKDLVEHKGGHKLFWTKGARPRPIQREEDVHVLYRMAWFGTSSDVTREANDGRGPADFKISRGVVDKSLVEFKLGSNTQLERNLLNQTKIYEKASDAKRSLKAIICFSRSDQFRVGAILKRNGLTDNKDIVLIDARRDNKPSGSKAG